MPEVKTEKATAPQLSPPPGSYYPAASPPVVSRAVFGPFTLRDLLVIGCSLAIFLVSLIPSRNARGIRWFMMWSDINWISGFVYVGAVVAVGVLFAVRRIAPQLSWAQRLGSFSVDQLASVVAVYSAIDWFSKMVVFSYLYVSRFGADDSNLFIATFGFFFALLYVFVTVGAPNIPRLRDDFDVRPRENAHRVARAIVPAVKLRRPVVKPPQAEGASGLGPGAHTGRQAVSEAKSPAGVPADVGPDSAAYKGKELGQGPGYSPFWFAVARETEVADERTRELFVLQPGIWYLALQDFGSEFLVTDRNSLSQEKNPTRRGILKDIEDVERA